MAKKNKKRRRIGIHGAVPTREGECRKSIPDAIAKLIRNEHDAMALLNIEGIEHVPRIDIEATIRNGDDARRLFHQIVGVMEDFMCRDEPDAAKATKVALALEHLRRLLSAWDSHNRLEECYRRAILDRCWELQKYMTEDSGFVSQIALLTIAVAAQYAKPTAQRKLLPVAWGCLVDPQYIEELKAEVKERMAEQVWI